MSKSFRSGPSGELNGLLDAGCRVTGDLVFDSSFRVHGLFKGTVQSEGELIVGEGGVVEGEIRVGELTVSGRLVGTVEATRRIQIGSNGRVEGAIRCPIVVIESGAFFQGPCTMQAPRRAKAVDSAAVDSMAVESEAESASQKAAS